MKSKKVDLHIHSIKSDGCWTSEEIFILAQKEKLELISITDHNTINDVNKINKLALKFEIDFINGIEITALDNGKIVHILGYGFEPSNDKLIKILNNIKKEEESYYYRYVKLLEKDGFKVTLDEYYIYKSKRPGGWKLLNYLLDKKVCADGYDYFSLLKNYSNENVCKYPTVEEVIEIIKVAKGIPILAHPGVTFGDVKDLTNFLKRFHSMGMLGIECYHSLHNDNITNTCLEWCKLNSCIVTGGSDSHGNLPDRNIGKPHIELSYIELKKLYCK